MKRTCAEYVEQLAPILGAPGSDFHVFDLSECGEIVEAMSGQYESGSRPVFCAPPPEGCSVVYCAEIALVVRRDGDRIAVMLAESAFLNSMREKMVRDRDYVGALLERNPGLREELRATQGAEFLSWLDEPLEDPDGWVEAARDGLVDCGNNWSALPIFASCAFEVMAMPVVQVVAGQGPRPVRRRLQRANLGIVWRTISLTHHRASPMQEHSPGDRRALHYCRGHWRESIASPLARMVGGKLRIWIEGHWKGDPSKGIILHSYTANARDAWLRGAA